MADIIEIDAYRGFECDCGCPNARFHDLTFAGAMAAAADVKAMTEDIGAAPVLERVQRELRERGWSLWLYAYIQDLALTAANF
jgi:hypothetical protein